MSDPKQSNPIDEEQVLPPSWAGLLAQTLVVPDSSGPSAQTANVIKQKVLQRIGAASGLSSTVTTNSLVTSVMRDSPWTTLNKKIQVKIVFEDDRTISWLLKMLPGGLLAPHDHADGVEECMVLEGELSINGVQFKAGDYQVAHPGSIHHQVATEKGALLFLKSPASRKKDLVPA
jgi:anti-sigma factor ChrR (cupin superfamily)